MDNKKMSVILKSAVVFIAALGAVMFAVLIPALLNEFVTAYPEFRGFYIPWLVFLSVAAVPLYVILSLGFAVACEIGKNRCFVKRNVTCLSCVAVFLLIEAVYFFGGNLGLWFFNLNYPLIVIAALLLSAFAAAIAAAFFVLAQLLKKAVALREENEAII